MITIEQVIEQCAKVCDELPMYGPDDETADWYGFALADCAKAIRALTKQYEGCIVAEGSAATLLFQDEDGVNQIIFAESHPSIVEMLEAKPLYRAREPK